MFKLIFIFLILGFTVYKFIIYRKREIEFITAEKLKVETKVSSDENSLISFRNSNFCATVDKNYFIEFEENYDYILNKKLKLSVEEYVEKYNCYLNGTSNYIINYHLKYNENKYNGWDIAKNIKFVKSKNMSTVKDKHIAFGKTLLINNNPEENIDLIIVVDCYEDKLDGYAIFMVRLKTNEYLVIKIDAYKNGEIFKEIIKNENLYENFSTAEYKFIEREIRRFKFEDLHWIADLK